MMAEILHQLPPDFVQVFHRFAHITWQAVSPSPQMSRKFTLTTQFQSNTESVPSQCMSRTLLRNYATNYDNTSDHTTIGCKV
jgi:hypothetical protein